MFLFFRGTFLLTSLWQIERYSNSNFYLRTNRGTMNILCFMLMTLRHVYSRGAKTKLLDISYWLVPSSRDSDIPWGQSFLVLEAVGFARAALSWDHWNKNSELEHYYQKSQGSHWHRHQSRQTRQDIFQFSAWDGKDFFEPFFLGSAGWGWRPGRLWEGAHGLELHMKRTWTIFTLVLLFMLKILALKTSAYFLACFMLQYTYKTFKWQ